MSKNELKEKLSAYKSREPAPMCTKFTDRLERSAILKKHEEPKPEKIFYPTGNKICLIINKHT